MDEVVLFICCFTVTTDCCRTGWLKKEQNNFPILCLSRAFKISIRKRNKVLVTELRERVVTELSCA